MAGPPGQSTTGTATGSATPAPALVLLWSQLNGRWTGRPRGLDGILRDPGIGPPSDHHVGNALDLTRTQGRLDEYLVGLELVRQMRANPVGGRLSYVIQDGQIASARSSWLWRPYTRSCPHRRHIHLSVKATHRGIVRPWNLERLPTR